MPYDPKIVKTVDRCDQPLDEEIYDSLTGRLEIACLRGNELEAISAVVSAFQEQKRRILLSTAGVTDKTRLVDLLDNVEIVNALDKQDVRSVGQLKGFLLTQLAGCGIPYLGRANFLKIFKALGLLK